MRRRRLGSSGIHVGSSAELHKQFVDSYASHLQHNSSNNSLSHRSKRTRASAEFGMALLSRKESDLNQLSIFRKDSKPQM